MDFGLDSLTTIMTALTAGTHVRVRHPAHDPAVGVVVAVDRQTLQVHVKVLDSPDVRVYDTSGVVLHDLLGDKF